MRINSVELWRGQSCLDGAPIVVLASGLKASANSKTGQMIQVYIIRQDMAPNVAAKQGLDVSVCGECPHRSKASGGSGLCYVQIYTGPRSLWGAWNRGNVPRAEPEHYGTIASGAIRWGAYGDPAAVPLSEWTSIKARLTRMGWKGHQTGYTHQWRTLTKGWRWLMASCDSPDDTADARLLGWRTFRVRTPGTPLMWGELECPASKEAGKLLTCSQCRACNGGAVGADRSIVAHGLPPGATAAYARSFE